MLVYHYFDVSKNVHSFVHNVRSQYHDAGKHWAEHLKILPSMHCPFPHRQRQIYGVFYGTWLVKIDVKLFQNTWFNDFISV